MNTKNFKLSRILTIAIMLSNLTLALAISYVTVSGAADAKAEIPHESEATQEARPTPLLDVTPPSGVEGSKDKPIAQELASLPGYSEDWWAAVQEQIHGDLYSLTADEAEGGAATYSGYNPDHGFELTFAAGGVRVAPAAAGPEGPGGGPSWTWELRTTGYGYEGDVRSLQTPAETASDANRMEYRRAGLSEWYANDERGLEQGFTLDNPPAGAGEVIVLKMALDTSLVPTLTGDLSTGSGQSIEFTQPDGNVVLLRYSDLYAYDAAGQQLPAHMELSGCGRDERPGSCRLQLLVESAGARYPLSIDPLLTVPDWAALGENTEDEFGYSVSTAGDVNGDGFADLVIGAWGNDEQGGKAYVYHGSPAGLEDTPAWSRAGDDGEQFGYSVSTAGDVNGDGYDDLVVGAPYNGSTDRGAASVYLGSPAGLTTGLPDWYALGEIDWDHFGWSVATAGDVNGDGYDDMVVGAPGSDCGSSFDCGKVYVFHGGPAGLATGPADWAKVGEGGADQFGYVVGSAGNVNGEENGRVYADLVVGAPGADCASGMNCGRAYVYHGQAGGLQADPAWSDTGDRWAILHRSGRGLRLPRLSGRAGRRPRLDRHRRG
jgi:hypothetical protein